MSWVLFSLIAAFGGAGMRLVNQHYAVSGFHLAIFVKIILFLITLPFALSVSWPQNPLFYLAVAGTIPLIIYGDQKVFNLCGRYGGGPVSRLEPLDNMVIFILWCVLNFSLFNAYLEEPSRFTLIVLSVTGSVIFAFYMRSSPVSLEIFRAFWPVILAVSFTNILNKYAMDISVGENGVLIYIFFQSFLTASVGLVYMTLFSKTRSLSIARDPLFLKACLFISVLSLLHIACKANAFILVENPAYVTVMNLTAPIWILAYNRLTGYPDNIKVLPGLGIVACACVLVLASRL